MRRASVLARSLLLVHNPAGGRDSGTGIAVACRVSATTFRCFFKITGGWRQR